MSGNSSDNGSQGSNGTGTINGTHTDHKSFAISASLDDGVQPVDRLTLNSSIFQLNLYGELNAAETVAELGDRVMSLVNRLGFSNYSFTVPVSAGDSESHLIMIPPEIREMYKKEGFYEYDMVTLYAKSETTPIFDIQIDEYIEMAPFQNDIITQNREMFRMLKSFGYYGFYVAPCKAGVGDGNVCLALGIKDKSPLDLQRQVNKHRIIIGQLLRALNAVVSSKFADFFWPVSSKVDIRITAKPLQLLTEIAREDLTLAEAANRLSISLHTANQHMAAARKAVGARTTTGAIANALRARLIEL